MDSDEALYAKLSTEPGIAALCSTRVYPMSLPQDVTLPALTYQIVSDVIESTHDEIVGAGFAHAHYQIDAWAGTYPAAVALARQVHLALHTYRGTVPGTVPFKIILCMRTAKRPNKDPETDLFWVSQDFEIWFEE